MLGSGAWSFAGYSLHVCQSLTFTATADSVDMTLIWLAQVFGHVNFFESFMKTILCTPGALIKPLVCHCLLVLSVLTLSVIHCSNCQ